MPKEENVTIDLMNKKPTQMTTDPSTGGKG